MAEELSTDDRALLTSLGLSEDEAPVEALSTEDQTLLKALGLEAEPVQAPEAAAAPEDAGPIDAIRAGLSGMLGQAAEIPGQIAEFAEPIAETRIPLTGRFNAALELGQDLISSGAEAAGRAGVPPAIAGSVAGIPATALELAKVPETVGDAAMTLAVVAAVPGSIAVGKKLPILGADVGVLAGKAIKAGERFFKGFARVIKEGLGEALPPSPPITGRTLSEQLLSYEGRVEAARAFGAADPLSSLIEPEMNIFLKYRKEIRIARKTQQPLEKVVGRRAAEELAGEIANKPLAQALRALEDLPRPERVDPVAFDTVPAPTAQAATEKVVRQSARISEYLGEANRRAEIMMRSIDDIETTGTLPKNLRSTLRGAGKPLPERGIAAFQISQDLIQNTNALMVRLAREIKVLRGRISAGDDPVSNVTITEAGKALELAMQQFKKYANESTVQRFSVNRAMKAYDKGIPQDVIDAAREVGVQLGNLKSVKDRLPLIEAMIENVKTIGTEKFSLAKLARNATDAERFNLFSPFSWTLDLAGNVGAQIGAITGGIGHDIGYVARTGRFTIPATRALWSAIRNRSPIQISDDGIRIVVPKHLRGDIEESFGSTVSGEKITGGFTGETGAFFNRPEFLRRNDLPIMERAINFGKNIADYAMGSPLYAKGAVDAASKRFGAMVRGYTDANIMADEFGLMGLDRKLFREKFMQEIPTKTAERMIEAGNEVGFNRPLSSLEESISESTAVKLMVSTFPRWGFQFTRWAAEMVGLNPKFAKLVLNKTARPEDFGEFAAKAATGWGGIYLLSETIYNDVDPESMQYIREDGNRVRLSNRDPITTGLFLAAVVKGDADGALAMLPFTSLPGAQAIGGEPGLLGGMLILAQKAQKDRKFNPRRFHDDIAAIINRAIPGQALLSAIESIMDPTIRSGIGANIPFVSKTRPPVINPANGEPLIVENVDPIFGMSIPSIAGTVIPGAARVLDPVQKLLNEFNFTIYRGPRSPIGSIPPSELPDEMLNEYLVELGKQRQLLLGPIAPGGRNRRSFELVMDRSIIEATQDVGDLDSEAAANAREIIQIRHNLGDDPRQALTRRQRGMSLRQRQALEKAFATQVRRSQQ